jgi:hypothetical protein
VQETRLCGFSTSLTAMVLVELSDVDGTLANVSPIRLLDGDKTSSVTRVVITPASSRTSVNSSVGGSPAPWTANGSNVSLRIAAAPFACNKINKRKNFKSTVIHATLACVRENSIIPCITKSTFCYRM